MIVNRITYKDKHTIIRDVIDSDTGNIVARKVTMMNEFGSWEKDYHRVFWNGGVPDPLKGAKGVAEDD